MVLTKYYVTLDKGLSYFFACETVV